MVSRVGSGEGYPFLLFNGGRLGELPAVAHNKPTEQPYARSAGHTLVREDLKVFWIFSYIDLAPNEKSPIRNCRAKAWVGCMRHVCDSSQWNLPRKWTRKTVTMVRHRATLALLIRGCFIDKLSHVGNTSSSKSTFNVHSQHSGNRKMIQIRRQQICFCKK